MKALAELFRTLITMSVAGFVLAAALFAIKPLTKKRLPKAAQYYLWLAVLAALVIPLSRLVVLPANAPASTPINDLVTSAIRMPETPREQSKVISGTAASAPIPDVRPSAEPVEAQTQPFDWRQLIPVVPAVSAFFLLYTLIGYFRFTARIKRDRRPGGTRDSDMLARLCGTRYAPGLYRSAAAATPMLIGLLRPAIVLPERDFTDAQLQSVLLHELTHLRRLDICVKWLSTLACALHWFNPLAWLTRRELDRACELSCDEAVIRGLDADGKQCYGETLIAVASDNKTPRAVLSTTMCERKRTLKERLGAIMEHKRHTRLAVIVSVALIAAAVLASCALGAGRSSVVDMPEVDTPPVTVETPVLPAADETDGDETHTDTPNPRYGYKVPLPESYKGKVLFGTETYNYSLIISVYHEATVAELSFAGHLFGITRYTPAEFEDLVYSTSIINGCYPFAKDDEYFYWVERAADVKSQHEEFALLCGEINTILEDFIEANNLEPFDLEALINRAPFGFHGNHIFLDVTLTDGTKFRIAMSQPVTQGEGGIWCVDRMYFDSGETHAIAGTGRLMVEYYSMKQAAADADPSKLQTPEEVARKYLADYRGWTWEITDMLFAGMYDPDDIPPPQYTAQDITNAREAVHLYFSAMNSRVDDDATQFTDIEVRLAPDSTMRDSYLRYGNGGYNGTLPNDCIVFVCSFRVRSSGSDAWHAGRYEGWNIILIRADAESPWLIASEGY